MSDLTLSEADLMALAAALAPLILPTIRLDLALIVREAFEQAMNMGDNDPADLALAAVRRLQDRDDKRFQNTTPITVGTIKGERDD